MSSLSIGPRGDLVAAGEAGGSVTLWSVTDRQARATLPIETRGGYVVTVALSPDGATLATVAPAGQPQTKSGCFGCTVTLWNVDTSEKIVELAGHTIKPEQLAFNPDGTMLASTGGTETILWSVRQRAALATIPGSGPPTFSPDGRWLSTFTAADRITLWDVDPQSWRRTLCRIVGRELTAAEWTSYVPDRARVRTCA